jgi:hypothetical protein
MRSSRRRVQKGKDLLTERWGEVWGVDEEVDEEATATYLDVFRAGNEERK